MPKFPDTNLSLIARVQELQDSASWTEFLGIYQPVVYSMARRRQMQDADAHDVVQQVFLSIARSIEGWVPGNGQPPFRAWLTTIACNAITKALARRPLDRATGSTSVAEVLQYHSQSQVSKGELLNEARREAIRWASSQIRPEFSDEIWGIFQLTAIEGVPIVEVAKSSGRSAGSIYIARFRVIKRLKEKIHEVSRHWDLEEQN